MKHSFKRRLIDLIDCGHCVDCVSYDGKHCTEKNWKYCTLNGHPYFKLMKKPRK